MRIGLFIPCFIDSFFPEVGIATLLAADEAGAITGSTLSINGEQHMVQCASDLR